MARKRPRESYGTRRDTDGERPGQYTARGHGRGHMPGGKRITPRRPPTKGPEVVVKTPRGEKTVPLRRIVNISARTNSPIESRLAFLEVWNASSAARK